MICAPDATTLLWIEHYPVKNHDSTGRLSFVVFERHPVTGQLCHPEWVHLDEAEVEALIGGSNAPLLKINRIDYLGVEA